MQKFHGKDEKLSPQSYQPTRAVLEKCEQLFDFSTRPLHRFDPMHRLKDPDTYTPSVDERRFQPTQRLPQLRTKDSFNEGIRFSSWITKADRDVLLFGGPDEKMEQEDGKEAMIAPYASIEEKEKAERLERIRTRNSGKHRALEKSLSGLMTESKPQEAENPYFTS